MLVSTVISSFFVHEEECWLHHQILKITLLLKIISVLEFRHKAACCDFYGNIFNCQKVNEFCWIIKNFQVVQEKKLGRKLIYWIECKGQIIFQPKFTFYQTQKVTERTIFPFNPNTLLIYELNKPANW